LTFQVDEGSPSFPRPTGPWWFGCKSQPKGRRTPKKNPSFDGGREGGGSVPKKNDVEPFFGTSFFKKVYNDYVTKLKNKFLGVLGLLVKDNN